jgi:hypothetical protein
MDGRAWLRSKGWSGLSAAQQNMAAGLAMTAAATSAGGVSSNLAD